MRAKTEAGVQRILEAAQRGRDTTQKKKEKNIEEYYKSPNLCKNCGDVLPYENKNTSIFCSRRCSAIFNNKGVVRNPPKIKSEIVIVEVEKIYCLECNEQITNRNKTFCCYQCYILNRSKMYSNRFRSGMAKTDTTIRVHLRKLYKECCECHTSEWNGKPLVLEVHHKDGNSNNNHPDNLQLLCPNCHSQTDTHRNKNAGNGRHFRRERYKENKSY